MMICYQEDTQDRRLGKDGAKFPRGFKPRPGFGAGCQKNKTQETCTEGCLNEI